jgi:hypothetical protein
LQDEEIREKILRWMNDHFESWNFEEIKKGRSTRYELKVNNGNALDQGTGVRAVLPLVMQLFNPDVTLLAIDEPELGLEPRMQKIIFQAIKDATKGVNDFPLKRILIATHSHLFLDREDVSNDFTIEKNNGVVSINQLSSVEELQAATYRLLGSNPSDLFFPSNVVIVEGITDKIFLDAIYKIGKRTGIFSSQNMVFHFIGGYDKLLFAAEAIMQMLKTQAYTPVYKKRICALLDKPKQYKKLVEEARKYFGDSDNTRFVLLDLDAVEYYYPLSIVNDIFNQGLNLKTYSAEIERFLDEISKKRKSHGQFLNQTLSKRELVDLVANKLTDKHLDEIHPSILDLLKKADELAYR